MGSIEVDSRSNDSQDTAEHSHQEQSRRVRRDFQARKTIKADLVWRFVTILVRFLSVPLSIHLLGSERYGLWLTTSSLVNWTQLTQFGLGGSLTNELGKAYGQNDWAGMRRHISTAYVCFTVISCGILLLVFAFSSSPYVYTLLGIKASQNLMPQAHTLFLLTGGMFAVSLLFNATWFVCYGLQESYLIFIFFSIGSLVNLALLAILYRGGGGLILFSLCMGLPPLMANVFLTFYVFGWRHRSLMPTWSWFDRNCFRSLLSYGSVLLIAQVADLIIFSSANPLIASRLGLSQVPRYSIPLNLFMFVVNICDGICRAYLGGYSEAFSRKDWLWIRSAARRTRRIAMGLISAAALGIFFFGRLCIRIWAGPAMVPSMLLLGCMVLYTFLMVCSNTNTVLLLGLGQARLKAALQVFVALCHIFGFILLAPKLGLLAIPIAGAAGFLCDVIVSYGYTSRQMRAGTRAQLAMTGT